MKGECVAKFFLFQRRESYIIWTTAIKFTLRFFGILKTKVLRDVSPRQYISIHLACRFFSVPFLWSKIIFVDVFSIGRRRRKKTAIIWFRMMYVLRFAIWIAHLAFILMSLANKPKDLIPIGMDFSWRLNFDFVQIRYIYRSFIQMVIDAMIFETMNEKVCATISRYRNQIARTRRF